MTEGRDILEVGAKGVLGELVGELPGGSTALAVVQAVFAKCADRRARDLFAAIAESIGVEDWDTAASILRENIGKPWFDETLERGFRDIIESICPESRRCLGFLVAEFLKEQKAPDSRFRKAATLLRESTAAELRTFLTICGMHERVSSPGKPGVHVLIRGGRRFGQLGFFWFAVLHKNECTLGERVAEPENLEECKRSLVTHRIGGDWTGLSDSDFEGDPFLRLNDEDKEVLWLLSTCLRVLEQRDDGSG
jgi:hypothetical protein